MMVNKKKPHYLAFTAEDAQFMLKAASPVPPPDSGIWDFSYSRQEFYPTDAPQLPREKLLRLLLPHTLLPLDARAVAFTQQAGLPYVLPNSFLSARAFRDARDAIAPAIAAWTQRLPLEALNWSENWAHWGGSGFFHYCAYQIFMAARLAEHFQECDARLSVFLRRSPLFYDPGRSSDTAALLWAQVMGDRTLAMRYPTPRHQPVLPRALPQQDWSCLRDAAVFSYNEGCLGRHGPLMELTQRESGCPVVWMPYYFSLIPKHVALDFLRKGGGNIGPIPVRPLPLPGEKEVPMPADAGKILQAAAEGVIPHAAQLGPVFDEQARFYARLEAQLQMLCAVWSEFCPRVVVAENLAQPEYAVPLLAARRLGIPSIGVPHSAFHLPGGPCESNLPVTRQAFASAFTEDAFTEAESLSADMTGSFTAVAMQNEFPVQRYEQALLPRDDKINVLVVTGVPISATSLHLFTADPGYTEALRALCAPPPDLREKTRVRFKAHPGVPGFWDYRHAGIEQERILPIDSILAEALRATDVLVSLDYAGSPSCQAMGAGIPVITCLTEGCSVSRGPYPSVIVNAGLVAENTDAVWEQIRRLIADTSFRNDCFARQKAFYKVRLRPRRDDWIAWFTETMAS